MAASIGLCMGTTFALCTAIPVAGEVHSPQARKRAHNRAGHEFEDVAMKHRSHGGHGGHGKHHDDHDGPGGGPGGENNDALRYQISEIHERVLLFPLCRAIPPPHSVRARLRWPCFFCPLIASEHTLRDQSCRAMGTLGRLTGMPFWKGPISGS
jgi:hypothetical protein